MSTMACVCFIHLCKIGRTKLRISNWKPMCRLIALVRCLWMRTLVHHNLAGWWQQTQEQAKRDDVGIDGFRRERTTELVGGSYASGRWPIGVQRFKRQQATALPTNSPGSAWLGTVRRVCGTHPADKSHTCAVVAALFKSIYFIIACSAENIQRNKHILF